MGEADGGEEKGRPDTKPFRKSCDTSKIWMWQSLDNTQYSLTSLTASKYHWKPLKFVIDVLISCYVRSTQRTFFAKLIIRCRKR